MKRSATKRVDLLLPADVVRHLNAMVKGTSVTRDQLITAILITHLVMMAENRRRLEIEQKGNKP